MPSRYQGTPEECRALNAFITLMRAANSVSERAHDHFAAHDLTSGQFAVLEAIHHCGPLKLGELAAKLLVTCGNITAILKNLESRRLALRVRDENDRRIFRVELTPEGKRLLAAAFPPLLRSLVEQFGILSESEQEELRRLCRVLGTQRPEPG
jgi:MarR family transcriptional regulator, 2-MHQ and catechol-resistance regulon repressor